MILMNEAIKRLVLHEGLQLQPYRCPAGFLTIGVGRNLETNPLSNEEKKYLGRHNVANGISKNEAIFLLKNDILRYLKLCQQKISFFAELDDERQYALLDMAFNLGIKRLLDFRKMLNAMSIGDYRGAAKECLNSRYAKIVGIRAKRIAKLIEQGIWSI